VFLVRYSLGTNGDQQPIDISKADWCGAASVLAQILSFIFVGSAFISPESPFLFKELNTRGTQELQQTCK
jgi:hypothetical protein